MTKNVYAVSLRERLSYALGDVGCNFVWSVVASFLILYYTDSVGISAAVVGTLMLVTRLLDGLTDLGFGYILDKTKSKYGRARPWILWSTPMMAGGLILLFSVPDFLGIDGKVIYAYVTYIFLAAVAYTASNLSYNTLLSYMTNDQPSRISANSYRFLMTSFLVIILSYCVPPMTKYLGWTMTAVVFAVLATICFLITFTQVKERVGAITSPKDEVSGLEGFKLLFKNRYFYTICIMFISYYLAQGIFFSLGVYYCRDVLGDVIYYGDMNLCYNVCRIIGLIFLPVIAVKYGKFKVMLVGWVLMALGSVLLIFASSQIFFLYFGAIVRGLGGSLISACLFTIIADAVEFGEWKTGIRQAGLTNSATSFGMKVGTGLGTAVVGWGLAFGDYDGSLTVQSAYTLQTETLFFVGVPAVCFTIGFIAMLFTNIDKIYPKIIKDLEARKAQKTQETEA